MLFAVGFYVLIVTALGLAALNYLIPIQAYPNDPNDPSIDADAVLASIIGPAQLTNFPLQLRNSLRIARRRARPLSAVDFRLSASR
ncbi:hypothetical protein GCM10010116_61920 [Microbispora rosea subsp. aerata]|nr:hypothetical protein [Microbispora rosea]GGI66847.1 hypothetical protein GCM10010116_61920 [Microbispora rosea subsp. aerata]GLJ86706.1 hypothetical protein GCM10017588_54450 [Microbispora rosea subsp. aerata]